MENTLLEYLNKRFVSKKKDGQRRKKRPPGPVVTISREVGCSGLAIANDLARFLNKSYPGQEWKVLSKEIFEKSALELNLESERVSKIFKQVDRTSFDELLSAFSEKRYKSDRTVRRTVMEVIRTFAEDGYCIMVGRASNIITRDIKNSLHIRINAPLEFRIQSIMQKDHIDRVGSIAFIERVEKERQAYRRAVLGKDLIDSEIFDMTINASRFSPCLLTRLIMMAISGKNIMDDYKDEWEH